MRSGYDNYDHFWGNPYYDDNAIPLKGFTFAQYLFSAAPALVALHPKNGSREWHEFTGQLFDPHEWRLEEQRWDHQHCRVCQFSIEEGMTYWSTEDERGILCDACYEHYLGPP